MAPLTAKPRGRHVGQSLTRLEDQPLLTGRGRFAADISFPRQLHMRIVRSDFAHGRLRAIDADAALGHARRARGMDGRRRRRHSSDRFSAHADRRPRTVPPKAPGKRLRTLCRRTGRRNFRRRSVSRRGRSRAGHARRRGIAGYSARRRRDRRIRAGAPDRARHRAQGLRRRGCGLPHGAYGRRGEAFDRPAFRGTARNPRRHRALRRGARHAGALRRGEGAALEQGSAGAHAGALPLLGEPLRRACRRRLRDSRRDLSGGRAGVRRSVTHAAAGKVDRGPPRASHRCQSFARARP